jgi:hypothetical protein
VYSPAKANTIILIIIVLVVYYGDNTAKYGLFSPLGTNNRILILLSIVGEQFVLFLKQIEESVSRDGIAHLPHPRVATCDQPEGVARHAS